MVLDSSNTKHQTAELSGQGMRDEVEDTGTKAREEWSKSVPAAVLGRAGPLALFPYLSHLLPSRSPRWSEMAAEATAMPGVHGAATSTQHGVKAPFHEANCEWCKWQENGGEVYS